MTLIVTLPEHSPLWGLFPQRKEEQMSDSIGTTFVQKYPKKPKKGSKKK